MTTIHVEKRPHFAETTADRSADLAEEDHRDKLIVDFLGGTSDPD